MANRQEVQNSLLQAIDTIVHKRVDELDFDKTILATVENVVSPATGEHRLKYNGGSFSAFSKDGVLYEPNTLVYVQIPQNDFSKRKIIIDRASNVRSDNDIAIVSSNINNYMTLGVNTIKLKSNFKDSAKNGVGLNSYTPKDYLPGKTDEYYPFQDSLVLYDRATDGGFYDLDTTSLNTFLQEADALMMKANFRTILTQEQQLQANAEYALVADLVFNNVDNTYKTQGEMFKALEDKTVSERVEANSDSTMTTVNVTMGTYRKRLDTLFAAADTNSSANTIEAVFNLVNNFISLNTSRFTKQEEQIFTAFYQLGLDLKNIANNYNDNDVNEKRIRYSKQYLTYYQWFDKLLNENEPSEKTLSYVIDSSHMIGNPFNYGTYLPQYSIFPIDKENFKYIDRIYFYCNGFIENSAMWNWVNKNRLRSGISETRTVRNYPKEDASAGDTVSASGYLGKDIWTKGLEILPLKEITDEYNGYKLKLSTPLGGIFYSTDESEELKIRADFTYRDYTELTDRAKVYWFRKDARVTAADHEGFDYHGGPGWHVMSKKSTSLNTITINAANNLAYKNEYMCAVAYSDTTQGDILLKQYITIYNEACKREIRIQSSLGETFKFDAGTPLLTCMIGEDEEHLLSQDFEVNKIVKRQDEAFRFYWNIRTSNGTVYPLNQTTEEIQALLQDTVDLVQRSKLESTKKYLEDVVYPKGVNGNQVEYPVKNFASNSNLTFICQVYTTKDITSDGYLKYAVDNTEWYSIGDAELTLGNQGVNSLSEYVIVIENGDQVFQYSETGVAPIYASAVTASDFRHTDPLEIQELKTHLYYQNGLEVSEENYTVQWLYPTEESLIIPPDGLTIDPATNQINLWQNRTATFNIKDSYDYDALDNQIQCVINFNGVTYTKYTDFTFSKIGDNGTNGTDITAKIVVNGQENFLDNQPLTAYLDKNNNFKRWNVGSTAVLQLKLYNRSIELPSSDYDSYVVWDTAVGVSRTQFVEFTQQSDKTQCQIKWNRNKTMSGLAYRCQLIKVTARMKTTGQEYHYTFPFCTIQEGSYTSPFSINQKEYLKQILYNSDGRNPQYNKNQGVKINNLDGRPIIWNISGGLKNYGYAYNTTDIENIDIDGETASRENYYYNASNQQKYEIPFFLTEEKNSKAQLGTGVRYGLDKVFIHPLDTYVGESQDNNVHISVYDTAGAADLRSRWEAAKQDVDREYESKRKQAADAITSIYTRASTEAANNAEKSNSSEDSLTDYLKLCGASWVTFNSVTGEVYVIADGISLTLDEFADTLSDTRKAEISRRYAIYRTYGITTAQDLLATDTYQQALKDAQDIYNKLDSAYKTALERKQQEIYSNIYTSANKYEIVVPIYLGLNTFGLASLNAWDGTKVDINEDLGYVLAPQMGAGQKHNDNTFSGILMGALESYDEYKKTDEDKTIGLMGFHHGLQSILLDAHTGKAIFGLPEQVRQYNDGELQIDRNGEVITKTDYTQGRIILEPNGTSQIGMWKIGSRALYNKNRGPLLDGSYKYEDKSIQNSLDYAPAPGHILDIPPVTPITATEANENTDTYGVLLSADPPYLYIKGKRVEGVDSSNAMAYINNGDSLGIQLDPQAYQSPFTIFRHYYDTKENQWKRQFRVGINSLGEFLANGLINPVKEDSDAAKTTGTGIGPLGAFGKNAADGRYIGGRFTHGDSITPDKIIIKMFVDTEEGDENTANRILYISGATDVGNEYQRPISIHGKNIRMFADSGNSGPSKITDSCFILDRTYGDDKSELVFLGHLDKVSEGSDEPDGHYLKISDQETDWGTILRSDKANTHFILGKKFEIDVGKTTVLNSGGNIEINPAKDQTWTIGLPHKIADGERSDTSGAGTLYSGKDIKIYSNGKVSGDNTQGWEFVLSEQKAFITQRMEGAAEANGANKKPLFLLTSNEACWYAPADIAIESESGKIDIGANSTSGINLQTITTSSGSSLKLFANGSPKEDGEYQPEIQLIASLGANKNKKITRSAVIEAMKTDIGSNTTAIWNIKPNIQTASIQLTTGSGVSGENRAIHGDGAVTIKTDSGNLNLSPAGTIEASKTINVTGDVTASNDVTASKDVIASNTMTAKDFFATNIGDDDNKSVASWINNFKTRINNLETAVSGLEDEVTNLKENKLDTTTFNTHTHELNGSGYMIVSEISYDSEGKITNVYRYSPDAWSTGTP